MTANLVSPNYGSVDCGAGGTSAPSGTITVPAGCTELIIFPVFRAAAAQTISSMTFNSVACTQVPSSRVVNPTNGDSAECWHLDNPTVGAHTLAATVSGSVRWRIDCVLCDRQYVGIGLNGLPQPAVSLSPAPAKSSLVIIGGMNEGAPTMQAGAFQNNAQTFSFSSALCVGQVRPDAARLSDESRMADRPLDGRWSDCGGIGSRDHGRGRCHPLT